jgi:hypothetical protein
VQLKRALDPEVELTIEEKLLIGAMAAKSTSPQVKSFPITELIQLGGLTEDIVIAIEQELVATRALRDSKQTRVDRGRDIGEKEAEATDPISGKQAGTERNEAGQPTKNGGGEEGSLPSDADVQTQTNELMKEIDALLEGKEVD